MTLDRDTIITLIAALVTAFFGGYVSFLFASKSRKNESILRFREEKYANLLVLLQGFVGDTANTETKLKFFEEQYKSWLYSSDEVVIAVNNLINLVKNNSGRDPEPEEGKKAIGDIVLAMRKDLLQKTSLRYDDFRYTNVRG